MDVGPKKKCFSECPTWVKVKKKVNKRTPQNMNKRTIVAGNMNKRTPQNMNKRTVVAGNINKRTGVPKGLFAQRASFLNDRFAKERVAGNTYLTLGPPDQQQ